MISRLTLNNWFTTHYLSIIFCKPIRNKYIFAFTVYKFYAEFSLKFFNLNNLFKYQNWLDYAFLNYLFISFLLEIFFLLPFRYPFHFCFYIHPSIVFTICDNITLIFSLWLLFLKLVMSVLGCLCYFLYYYYFFPAAMKGFRASTFHFLLTLILWLISNFVLLLL